MINIFTEVDAALRRDQMSSLWWRYRVFVIAILIGIVLVIAAVTYYSNWRATQAQKTSSHYDRVIASLVQGGVQTKIPEADRHETPSTIWNNFSAEHSGGYATLGQFRRAEALVEAGDLAAAADVFTVLAQSTALPDAVRDFARLQSVQTRLGRDSLATLEAQLAPLLDVEHPYYPLARETLALALILADAPMRARTILESIQIDLRSSALTRARAEILLASLGATPDSIFESGKQPSSPKSSELSK